MRDAEILCAVFFSGFNNFHVEILAIKRTQKIGGHSAIMLAWRLSAFVGGGLSLSLVSVGGMDFAVSFLSKQHRVVGPARAARLLPNPCFLNGLEIRRNEKKK